MKRDPRYLIGATVAVLAGVAMTSSPAAASPCTDLISLQLPNTTINSAADNATGTFVYTGNPPSVITGLPPFCRVTATLVPTSDSSIKIEAWLPLSGWNGRFLGTGGGGYQGDINYTGSITYLELPLGLRAGFASINSDLGTTVSGCNPLFCGSNGNMGNPLAAAEGDPLGPTTGLLGHPARIEDFGSRAIHLMTVRGKEIVSAFYKKQAKKAYFFGCSTGGQNALMEAQRFPNDYDGIVAGAAGFNRTHLHMSFLAEWQNAHASAGRMIQPGQMTLINQAVLKQCAGKDGGAGTDPFLTDPRQCNFDPKALLCTGGNVPPACLTADQVTTMQNYYAGTIDPVNKQVIQPGYARGDETDDLTAIGLAFQEQLPEPAFDGLFYWVYGPSFGYPASPVNYANFDFHHAVKTVDDQLAAVLNATSTDLSAFRQHGGKLLMFHGWADPAVPSQSSINYFNALVGNEGRGGRNDEGHGDHNNDGHGGNNPAPVRTQTYARLFMAPGLRHCTGGPGPNTFDTLTPLVNWVENGVAPETLLATKYVADTPPLVQMTRPLCAYPKYAKYNGSGNPNVAASFTCVPGENGPNQVPAPQYGP